MTISRRLFLGYAVVLAVFALVTAIAIYSVNGIRAQYEELSTRAERAADVANTLALRVRDQVIDFRGVLLYPSLAAEFREGLATARAEFDAALESLRQLGLTPQEEALLEEIAARERELAEGQDRFLAEAVTGDDGGVERSEVELAGPTSAVLDLVGELRSLQAQEVGDARVATARAVRSITITMLVVGGIAIVVGLATAFYLGRAITRPLREGVLQLTAAASQILATTAEVAAATAESAGAVSETTATVEEVKQTSQVATDKAKQVADSARRMSEVAQAGRDSIERTIDGMHDIQEQMSLIASTIVQLAEQSQAIGEIVATVNDLAEQSNLLAVNAAIEATRAGEHGKGFAVVAQEVKSLAVQSKQATAQVRTLLADVQKATNAAVLAAEQGDKAVETGVKQTLATGEVINTLAETVAAAADAATQIVGSNQQQMVGMDQVALAMENIKQASSQNVAGTRQAEAAARDLQELAKSIRRLISTEEA
ncbi:MAG TPA: methyl-accepting chemotaxis protein [Trueperaceae bacterium]|jgi:methyl-accepting chemotaxis protein